GYWSVGRTEIMALPLICRHWFQSAIEALRNQIVCMGIWMRVRWRDPKSGRFFFLQIRQDIHVIDAILIGCISHKIADLVKAIMLHIMKFRKVCDYECNAMRPTVDRKFLYGFLGFQPARRASVIIEAEIVLSPILLVQEFASERVHST